MTFKRPFMWSKWLSLAEWWYNANFHSYVRMIPFQALYEFPTPFHTPYVPVDFSIAAVDQTLTDHEYTLRMFHHHLLCAQSCKK